MYSGKQRLTKVIALCVRNGCYLMIVHVIVIAQMFLISIFISSGGELSKLLSPWNFKQKKRGAYGPQYDSGFLFFWCFC